MVPYADEITVILADMMMNVAEDMERNKKMLVRKPAEFAWSSDYSGWFFR